MVTFTFPSCKGGVGKTTISVHLAVYFSSLGLRVLFVDMDGTGNGTSRFLRIREGSKIVNYAHASELELDTVGALYDGVPTYNAIIDLSGGNKFGGRVDILSSDEALLEPNRFGLGKEASKPTFLRDKLAEVSDEYDVCIIDTHPDSSIFTQQALFASDFIYPVFSTDTSSFDTFVSGTSPILFSVIKAFPDVHLDKAIINSHNVKGADYDEMVEKIHEHGFGVFPPVAIDMSIHDEMGSRKTTAYELKKTGKTSQSFNRLGGLIMKDANLKPRGSSVSRFFENKFKALHYWKGEY